MPMPGSTSDLYVEGQDGTKVALGSTPSAPTDVPPPVAPVAPAPLQPVRGVRMADQDSQGNVRDTSTEALRPGNDLNFRNVDDEQLKAQKAAKEAAPAPADVKPAEPAPVEAPKAAPTEKLYAGKYKSVEDMEKAYQESQRLMHEATEKAARLEREATTRAVTPPAVPVEAPEMVAAREARNKETLARFVNDPDNFVQQEIIGKVQTALTAQQRTEQWRRDNPDLAKHEVRVAFEATLLAQSDPELARNPEALLQRATTQFREFAGLLRTEGAKEALTQETRVIPLTSTTAPPATEHPPQAPLTASDAFDNHLKMLKEAQNKSRHGLHH